ncbi:3-isopropylmalate dehydratase [Caenimonas terrae]|uniref:3-isopropylmalate dehydratase n=1 Tax=Caenimonas terrae TaxID=696074 RepID=A0ABW0NBY7_9BURK
MGSSSSSGARVWRLGADVDTDVLAPGHAMKHGIDVIARHCLESVRPEFAASVQAGDVIAAGPNFGIGSSREQAAAVLVQLGIAAVIAPSYSGLYFRNAFNVGLLLLTCAQAEQITEGERIAFDARAGRIVRAGGQALATEPIPDFLLDMVEAGGLLAQLQQRFQPRTPS